MEKFKSSLVEQAKNNKVIWYPTSVIEPNIMIIDDRRWDKYLKWIEGEKNKYGIYNNC